MPLARGTSTGLPTIINPRRESSQSIRPDDFLLDRLQQYLRATINMARRRGSRDRSGDPALDINIAEPAVFIPTYTHNPAVLRGSCTLVLKESYALKKLTVNFRGVSHVLWPHGTSPSANGVYLMSRLMLPCNRLSRQKDRYKLQLHCI